MFTSLRVSSSSMATAELRPANKRSISVDQNSTFVSKSDAIIPNGSSYFLGADGRGTITLNTGDNDIGGNGLETFTVVYLNSSHALIAQGDIFDSQNFCYSMHPSLSHRYMDLQTSTAAISGGYAFRGKRY